MIRRAAPWLLALFVVANPAAAQAPSELRLEAGYARVRQREQAPDGSYRERDSDAGLVAAFWRRPFESWTFLASGNVTYGRDSIAAAQAVAAFSAPWSIDDRLRTEGGVAGARFSLASAGRGGNANAFARQHYLTDRGGTWLGAGVAQTTRDSRYSHSTGADFGVWGRLGFLYGSGSYGWQQSSDRPLLTAAGQAVDPAARLYTLSDVELVVEARGGPNSLALSWASRRGISGDNASRVIAVSTSGILQVTERVAFTATAGRQLADPLRGLPQAELLTASLRVSFGEKPLPVMQRSAIASASVEPAPGGGGELVVRVFAADTMVVEVAGDFSNWQPVALHREGGLLVARVRLGPGKYRVAVRVNLGGWRAPRNLARVRDDFGGEAGILVIP